MVGIIGGGLVFCGGFQVWCSLIRDDCAIFAMSIGKFMMT